VWAAIALAFGLAMDATAVSAARGLAGHLRREIVILPLLFGIFQSGMAGLGLVGGTWAGPYLVEWEHWIAFGLLVVIGGKMVIGALRGRDEAEHVPGTLLLWIGLAIATSIDAAAAGLTLPLLDVAPWLAILLIGAVTTGCSVLAFIVGRAIGHRLGSRLEILGGIVLIGIGIDMAIQAVWR
jgi:putative Mn2+ efflux pump MntP